MGSIYQSQADAIDKEARQNIATDPELADRIARTLPYLSLEMFLKSPTLSVNQMVVAAGSTFGVRSKIKELVEEYLEKDLIETIEIEGEDETFYQIRDRKKAEAVFREIGNKRS